MRVAFHYAYLMQVSRGISIVGQRVRSFSKALINAAVPDTCLLCDSFVDKQGGCCPSCWRKLSFVQAPICPVMGTPFSIDMGTNFLSAEAIANPPPFDRLRTVLLYDEYARKLISLVKYSDRTDLIPWLANWMQIAGKELLSEADIILPVPLHPSRLRKRRFNQSADLARRIGHASKVEYVPDLLVRRKSTRQQVGLTEKERERNVSGAFIVPEAQRIHLNAKRVLLVDDVYTTGSTVRAATRALKRGGAGNIDVLVFAKVETSPS